jgi:hypothetical protein
MHQAVDFNEIHRLLFGQRDWVKRDNPIAHSSRHEKRGCSTASPFNLLFGIIGLLSRCFGGFWLSGFGGFSCLCFRLYDFFHGR